MDCRQCEKAGNFPATCLKSGVFSVRSVCLSHPQKNGETPGFLLFAEWNFSIFCWFFGGTLEADGQFFFHSQIRCFLVSSVFCTAQEACMEQIRDGP